ncbi:MAG TPA: hypothetical protein VKB71_06420 [Rhizomicrobium sp.]|nr:hypothetical protein [Rhizomicrobium sp.]
MTLPVKNMEQLTPSDFAAYPVWEFALDLEEVDDLAMRPVTTLPVHDLANRTVGIEVRLANGSMLWAGLGNIVLNDPGRTKRTLVASFYIGGQWIPLSRSVNAEMYGPDALARRLGLRTKDVFPITYDISAHCVGDREATLGSVEATLPP